MPRAIAAFALVAIVGFAGCESDPAGPILQVEGTYEGDWTFDVFIGGLFVSRAVCPGSITLAEQEARTYGGAFVVRADGDCTGISPLSGDVLLGRVRADGGVEFQLGTVPVVGAGIAGCAILVEPETRMNGAVEAGTLTALTVAGLDCGELGTGAAQVVVQGTRS